MQRNQGPAESRAVLYLGSGDVTPRELDVQGVDPCDEEAPLSPEDVLQDESMSARLVALCGWDIVAPGVSSEIGAPKPEASTAPQLRCALCGAKRVLRTCLEASRDSFRTPQVIACDAVM